MRSRWLLGALLLTLAFALAGCGAASYPTSTDQVAVTTIGSLVVTTRIPKVMQVSESAIARITLAPQSHVGALAAIPEEQTGSVTTPAAPVGTPSVPIDSAFGAGYEPYAQAQLASGAFDVQMVSQSLQSLRQPQVTWEWSITPLYAGQQLMDAAITVQWNPTGDGAHALPLNPTFTIATVDTDVTVRAAAASTPGVATVTYVGPFPVDTLSLSTGIIASVFAALLVSLFTYLTVKARKLRSTALRAKAPK